MKPDFSPNSAKAPEYTLVAEPSWPVVQSTTFTGASMYPHGFRMATNPSHRFETTAWSMVSDAKHRDGPEFLAAMNRFISGYWRPVFYFIRTHGYSLQQAEDLTQEFFLKFLERDWLQRANPGQGRFRTFLLTILNRFLSDSGASRCPRQKCFDERLVSISTLLGDSDRAFEPVDRRTPDQAFMHHWAHATVGRAQRALQSWCEENGRPDWYEVFSWHHLPPPGRARVSQQEIAERFRLSRDQVRYALEQTNRQFITLLRSEVTNQVDSHAAIEAEILELQRYLAD